MKQGGIPDEKALIRPQPRARPAGARSRRWMIVCFMRHSFGAFPGYRVDVVWHRDTVWPLGLPDRLKVHAARHRWAVLALRAGVPVRVVQCQLGQATPTLTLEL